MIRLFDFGPVLLAAMLVLLGTTEHGESTRVEEAAVASVDQTEAVVIPGLQVAVPQVPEVGAKVEVALGANVSGVVSAGGETVLTTFYWFLVDEDGKVVGTYLLYGTRPDMIDEGICTGGTTEICLYGSDTVLNHGDSIGATNPGNSITKNAL